MSFARSNDHKAVVLPRRIGNRMVALAISAAIPTDSNAGSIRVEPPEATALKKPETAPRPRPSPISVQSRVMSWSVTEIVTAVKMLTSKKPMIGAESTTEHGSARSNESIA